MLIGFGQVLLFKEQSDLSDALKLHGAGITVGSLFQSSGYVSHQPSSSAKNGSDVPSWDLMCDTRACSNATLKSFFIKFN